MEKSIVLEKVAQEIERNTLYKGVRVEEVVKNNGTEMEGISFPIKDGLRGTICVPRDVIEGLCNGDLRTEDVAAEVVKRFNSRKVSDVENYIGKDLVRNKILDKEKLLASVRRVVVNAAKNQNMKDVVPYKAILDLLITYRVFIDRYSSVLLSNQIMKEAGVTAEEVDEAARNNTRILYRMEGLDEVVERMSGQKLPKEVSSPIRNMRVVSCDGFNYGASAIADTDYLDTISKSYGGVDFVILPSSVNEIITVPTDEGICYKELISIVVGVNEEYVDPTEFLSDSVYIYKASTRSLEMIA